MKEPLGLDGRALPWSAYRPAILLTCGICLLWTIAGMSVSPSVASDPGVGMLAWRGLQSGASFNAMVAPDPASIARDSASFLSWWSPGQYLLPGVISLAGFKVGQAFVVTAALALLSCLLGWIGVARVFGLRPRTMLYAIAFLGTFRYSTLPFGNYDGGEVLLQGVTPWLVLAGCRIPRAAWARAAAIAASAVWVAFFAKLTGLIVALTTFVAGSVSELVRERRVTAGMIAGAAGALAGALVLEVLWFSRGTTPGTAGVFPFQAADMAYAIVAPWCAGISWADMGQWILFNPNRPVLHVATSIVWFMLPMAACFCALAFGTSRRNIVIRADLTRVALVAYAVFVVIMVAIYARGGAVSLDERHFRSVGTLLYVWVFAVVMDIRPDKWPRVVIVLLSLMMSAYGVASLVNRARSTAASEIDALSGTRQVIVGMDAVEFVRSAVARDADSIAVVPSPEIELAFPLRTRVIWNQVDLETMDAIAGRQYAGRVRGSIYVVMQTRVARSPKGPALLREFRDYSPDGWREVTFRQDTVYVQAAH